LTAVFNLLFENHLTDNYGALLKNQSLQLLTNIPDTWFTGFSPEQGLKGL